MKTLILTLFLSLNAFAQYGAQNSSGFTEREKQQQQVERNRKEVNDSYVGPNQKSSQTQMPNLNIDPDLSFQISNHLLGASTILEKDKTLTGVKLTGVLNLAYYNIKYKEEPLSNKKKGRLVFGVELPFYDFKRGSAFSGVGLSLGDSQGMYVDLGADYYLTSWFKVQGGLNWNSNIGINPMISLGFTW